MSDIEQLCHGGPYNVNFFNSFQNKPRYRANELWKDIFLAQ